jgi:hypothetical protein
MWMTAIPRERKFGFVRCSCVTATKWPLAGLQAVFGLRLEEQRMIQLDAKRATTVLASFLNRSFVAELECIPKPRAQELAEAFVNEVGGQSATFYTNGDWAEPMPRSWTPLTDSVFDGGVIAIGPAIAACVWIEEDD